jgi:hypothetical protein
MRLMAEGIMRIGIMAAVLTFGSVASAGTFTPIGEGAGTYSLTSCTRPAAPDLAIDPALKGREAVKAHNDKVKLYNAHVADVNAYLACISDEANRDLQLYYGAVQGTLETEQNAVLQSLETQGEALKVRF